MLLKWCWLNDDDDKDKAGSVVTYSSEADGREAIN